MNLIDNWRQAWRLVSLQLAAGAVAFGLLPADTQAAILTAIGIPTTRVPAIIGALFIVGRLVKQPAVAPSAP